jgi:Kdo2-lipid IVA lauroyltransferase/acyltransferase
MQSRTSDFLNRLVVFLLKGISKLPFPLIYGLSDFISVILQYGIKYRLKVILDNLRKAFPEKDEAEIRRIVRAFYVHFCDIFLETAKAWSMSKQDFEKRVSFTGLEYMNQLAAEGKSVIALAMHFNNWEWTSYSQVFLQHRYLVIYNPVRNNDRLEAFLTGMRERWGAETIPVHKSARTVIDFHKLEKPTCLGLVGDQRPPFITKFWTTFLNQEACFNSGPEKIAYRTNQPVVFALPEKVKRGYYRIHFIPLISTPASMSQEEIMLTYIRTMEKYIREAPEYYLWSHKRWKQQRPDNYPLYP